MFKNTQLCVSKELSMVMKCSLTFLFELRGSGTVCGPEMKSSGDKKDICEASAIQLLSTVCVRFTRVNDPHFKKVSL